MADISVSASKKPHRSISNNGYIQKTKISKINQILWFLFQCNSQKATKSCHGNTSRRQRLMKKQLASVRNTKQSYCRASLAKPSKWNWI